MNTLRQKSCNISSINSARRSVDVVASTESVDSYGEVVEQSWKLERYRSNPVVLFGHKSRDLPIGYAENIRIEGGALKATIVFVSKDANPVAEQVWCLMNEGAIRGVSVGFMPGRVKTEIRQGKNVDVLCDNELFEISVVPVPANPDGLARAKSSGFGAREPFKPSKLLAKAQASAREAEHGQGRELAYGTTTTQKDNGAFNISKSSGFGAREPFKPNKLLAIANAAAKRARDEGESW